MLLATIDNSGLRRNSLTAVAGPLAGLACLTAASATPVFAVTSLAPHRAVYEITLERASSSSGITDMSGRMVYEFIGDSCSGYTQKMRFVTRVVDRNGTPTINDLRTTSREDPAHDNMTFLLSQYRGTQLTETTEGTADRDGANDGIEVELMKPATRALRLDGPVYFPIEHSRALLAAAKEGRRHFPARLYDGSEQGETVYETSTFIGDALPAERAAAGLPERLRAEGGLGRMQAWPVAIGYYDNNSEGTDAAPSYELAFRFHANGVSTKLLIDYGDFAIRGDLSELKMLEASSCGRATTPAGTPAGAGVTTPPAPR